MNTCLGWRGKRKKKVVYMYTKKVLEMNNRWHREGWEKLDSVVCMGQCNSNDIIKP